MSRNVKHGENEENMVVNIQSLSKEEGDSDQTTIAHRTRTKYSLVDIPIDVLDSYLPDTDFQQLQTISSPHEDIDYHRFLASLLPQDEGNLSFLDEEDEEYVPDDEDEHYQELERLDLQATPRTITKKELTDLLITQEQMKKKTIEQNTAETNHTSDPPMHKITQEQRIRLASQMQKHYQLLVQSYYLICTKKLEYMQTNGARDKLNDITCEKLTSNLLKCHEMLKELETKYHTVHEIKSTTMSTLPLSEAKILESVRDSNTTHAPPRRIITRSVTAAHATVMSPTAFEIVGVLSLQDIVMQFDRMCIYAESITDLAEKLSIQERNQIIKSQTMALDAHLLIRRHLKRDMKKALKDKTALLPSEIKLLAHGVRYFVSSHKKARTTAFHYIQKHFLPSTHRSPNSLYRHYMYLSSRRDCVNILRHQYEEERPTESMNWVIEEDLRLLRNLLDFPPQPDATNRHKHRKVFAVIAAKCFPYRTRQNVRNRWYNLQKNSIQETITSSEEWSRVFEINENANDLWRDMLQRIITYFENKLRHKLTNPEVDQPTESPMRKSTSTHLISSICESKCFHPALFYSSWALLNANLLLQNTCEHNWPSFISRSTILNSENPDSDLLVEADEEIQRMNEHIHDLQENEVMDDGDNSEYEQEELLSSDSDSDVSSTANTIEDQTNKNPLLLTRKNLVSLLPRNLKSQALEKRLTGGLQHTQIESMDNSSDESPFEYEDLQDDNTESDSSSNLSESDDIHEFEQENLVDSPDFASKLYHKRRKI